ncbi:MAG: hypothetical protein MI748_04915 [Opitutales bacterium]|nr:hypothetical protein [Opitutales bacterium]
MSEEEELPEQVEEVHTPEFFEQFISYQLQQQEVEKEKLRISEKEIDTSHEFALESLKAQSENQRQLWQHVSRDRNRNQWFIFILILLLIVILGVALFLDHKDVVFEILKMVALIGGGFGGGYAYAINRRKNSDNDENA